MRYNISAAYDLADSMLAALKGHYGELYLEDFVEAHDCFSLSVATARKAAGKKYMGQGLLAWGHIIPGDSFSLARYEVPIESFLITELEAAFLLFVGRQRDPEFLSRGCHLGRGRVHAVIRRGFWLFYFRARGDNYH